MIYPTLKTLMAKVDSKYTLVVAVAKRARQLVSKSFISNLRGGCRRQTGFYRY
jgi:DNA-directed RNA polymerase omega subunit